MTLVEVKARILNTGWRAEGVTPCPIVMVINRNLPDEPYEEVASTQTDMAAP